MKKLLLVLTISLTSFSILAQGRIQFVTDSLHLVYYAPNTWLGGLGGQGVSSNMMPPGLTLVADLYMGTGSSSLSYYTTATFSSLSPGKWNTVNVQTGNGGTPAIPGGTTVFVVTQIRDHAHAPEATWTPGFYPFDQGFYWYAASQEFAFVLGTSHLVYPPMYAKGPSAGGGFSTWADGTFNMDSVFPGARGAITLAVIPEPNCFALVGLGVAALLTFRRRN